MAYYLSKHDRELLIPILDRLKLVTSDLSIDSSNPKRLSYLIRNAINVMDEYKELKDRFRLVVRDTRLILKVKQMDLNLNIGHKKLIAPTFMEAMTALFQGLSIIVEEHSFTDQELEQIRDYCIKRDYIIKISSPNNLTITANV